MTDIKTRLINKIDKINDEIILHQLSELISHSDQSITAIFSEEQIESLKKSQNQIKNGDSMSHEEVMKLMDKN